MYMCTYVIIMQLPTTRSGNHLGLRILAYYLIFFPSLDVMSAYPLVVHVLVNNIYIIIIGKDALYMYMYIYMYRKATDFMCEIYLYEFCESSAGCINLYHINLLSRHSATLSSHG